MEKYFKNITNKIKENLPDDVEALKIDVKQNFQSAIDAKIKKLDLVTREEFEIQEEVLKRTREKLEKLEEQLNSLEIDNKK
ncbi:MAG TPA: accessory factor UbiK family protein [Woeseiaceae bacterium]|nr:accessory factor UbiK family protein [Woeseiaceae bacterium]|tara:strand:+ start:862 stop:1104 length:243 start_codon:yes stop_codon:yes gene_type:complete